MTIIQRENTHLSPSKVYLNGDIDLTLHTKIAQRLLEGTWVYGKMGLWQFALKVRDLWNAHKNDNPYADWYFMKIDEKIHGIRQELKQLEMMLEQHLTQLRGFNIQIFQNPDPVRLGLKFAIPFSFIAASLLSELDYVSRQAYTLRHIGQILEPDKLPIHIAKSIRELFSLPLNFYGKVTRHDIVENNEKYQLAKEKMGEIPSAILNKEIKFFCLLGSMLAGHPTN